MCKYLIPNTEPNSVITSISIQQLLSHLQAAFQISVNIFNFIPILGEREIFIVNENQSVKNP